MKKIAHCILSLTLISAVCVGVLAVVNGVTRERIASLKQRARENAARLVMPASVKTVTTAEDADGAYYVGKDATGRALAYALTGKSQGYGGDIVLMVGLLPDRTIITYQKLEASETPGLGSNLTAPSFMRQFKGMSATKDLSVRKDGGEVEAITSATITSRAVCGAVNVARARLDKILAK
ncbi:MAG: RnfABCDGE type electron transport complex subunit G [Kiritimatiellae bacterium]|nr:RnfABCDGE type electron transport complex subunit G [Kiritimatiellia bacterium]